MNRLVYGRKNNGLLLTFIITAVIGPGVGYYKLWLFHVVLIVYLFYVFWKLLEYPIKINKTWYRSIDIQLLFLFNIWYVCSLIWSVNFYYSARYLFYLLIGSLIVLVVVFSVLDRKTYSQAVNTLVVILGIGLVIGLFEAFTSFRLPTSPYSIYAPVFGREAGDLTALNPDTVKIILDSPTSFWGNPNHFSVAMVMAYPFLLLLRRRLFEISGLILIITAIVMAGSRGTLIAITFGIIFRLFFIKPVNLLIVLFTGFLSIPLITAGVTFAKKSENHRIVEAVQSGAQLLSYFTEDLTDIPNSLGMRQHLIRNGLNALEGTYGLGVGAGGSQEVQERDGSVARQVSSMHNFWIEILIDGGVVGFILFLSFYINLMFSLFKIQRKNNDHWLGKNARILLISLFIFSVGCISASSVIYFLPMWLLFGFSIALIRIANSQRALFSTNSNNKVVV